MSTYGPCSSWSPTWTCDVSCESPVVTAEAAAIATEVLWALSGRQFGLCEVTLRPCRRDCATYPWPDYNPAPAGSRSPLGGGFSLDLPCGGCAGACSCGPLSEVVLPVVADSVTAVKVDGVVLSGDAYRLYDGRRLVRADGHVWPRCNDLSKADTEPGTWSVTASFGTPVPEGGGLAVGELACQLIGARNGQDCQLPASVTQLVRQGVTIQLPVTADLLQRGQTGLYLVDTFVATWNPRRLARRSGVYQVDGPAHRRAAT